MLEAYLVAGAAHVVQTGQLEAMLGVFQKLLATKASECHAFGMLKAIVRHVPGPAFEPYLPTVLQLLLTRLQQNTDRCTYCHALLAFFGLLAGTYGPQSLVNKLDAQQPGMLPQLVVHVLAKHALNQPFTDAVDAKAAAVCKAVKDAGARVPGDRSAAEAAALTCVYFLSPSRPSRYSISLSIYHW